MKKESSGSQIHGAIPVGEAGATIANEVKILVKQSFLDPNLLCYIWLFQRSAKLRILILKCSIKVVNFHSSAGGPAMLVLPSSFNPEAGYIRQKSTGRSSTRISTRARHSILNQREQDIRFSITVSLYMANCPLIPLKSETLHSDSTTASTVL